MIRYAYDKRTGERVPPAHLDPESKCAIHIFAIGRTKNPETGHYENCARCYMVPQSDFNYVHTFTRGNVSAWIDRYAPPDCDAIIDWEARYAEHVIAWERTISSHEYAALIEQFPVDAALEPEPIGGIR